MSYYLFVHFREKTTPAGEQVYFAVSKNAYVWETINNGEPVLWAYYGDKGVRDHTIIRNTHTGKFYILATDLSLALGMRNQYNSSWDTISRTGSKNLSMWESDNLVNWSEQRLVEVGSGDMGCVWAPDIIYSGVNGEYIVHWSSSHKSNNYGPKKIYFSKTKNFVDFSEPAILYEKEDSGVIDSAIYEEDGAYFLFVKSEKNPAKIILLKSSCVTGPFEPVEAFDEAMKDLEIGLYEAPTATRTPDGKWCLFIDYYGVRGAGQGYVPFVADSLAKANFKRFDTDFFFPYGFKHGTILSITKEEYLRIKEFNFDIDDYSSY